MSSDAGGARASPTPIPRRTQTVRPGGPANTPPKIGNVSTKVMSSINCLMAGSLSIPLICSRMLSWKSSDGPLDDTAREMRPSVVPSEASSTSMSYRSLTPTAIRPSPIPANWT